MRIGLDFSFLTLGSWAQVRGIPRFTQDQLQAALSLDSDNTYLLLCDSSVDVNGIRSEIRQAPNVQVVFAADELETCRFPSDRRKLLSLSSGYQRWLETLRLDLFHAPWPAMLRGVLMPGFDVCPYVATAYDLIPLLYPAHYLPERDARETYDQRLLFVERATRIAAISHATADDLVEHLGVPRERIDITSPAPSLSFRPLPRAVVQAVLQSLNHRTRSRSRRRVQIPSEYVLCITDMHYSKNMTTLLPAYAALSRTTRARVPLVVAGHLEHSEASALQRLAERLEIGDDVILTGRVSDEELAALYNGCTLTVHPSHYEGFGLPVIEAMRSGAPVITTTRSALPETAGDAALMVDSDDAAAFTAAIDRLLCDAELRDELRRRGTEQAGRFTLAELGSSTLRCYEAASSAAGRRSAIRVALWSPLPPQDSELAFHGDELATSLAAVPGLELHLFVDDGVVPPVRLLRTAHVHHHTDFDRATARDPFDVILYQISGSPSSAYMRRALLTDPGVVVLHDLQWSHALLADRLSRPDGERLFRADLNAVDGEQSAREWDRRRELPLWSRAEAASQFLDEHPMLGQVIDIARCCVTLTPALGRELVRRYPRAVLAGVIPLGVSDPEPDGGDRSAARAYVDLNPEAFFVVVPAGEARANDIRRALTAFAGLHSAGLESVLAIIGPLPFGASEAELSADVRGLGLGDSVRVIPHPDRVLYDAYIAAADVVLVLEDLGAGAVPHAVMRAFAARRCVVMSDTQAARSLPDDACLRVAPATHDAAPVTAMLVHLVGDAARRERVEQAAHGHWEQTARLAPMIEAYAALITDQAGRRVAPASNGVSAAAARRSGHARPRSGPLPYSKACELEDFAHSQLLPVLNDICAHKRRAFGAGYPAGHEYRKDWEVAMAVRTLADQGVLRPDARVLGVAAGTEDTVFYLTRHVGEVVAVDRYLEPGRWTDTAQPQMIVNPGRLAPFRFRPDRLTVQHMDARVLDFPDESFDGIFSSGSIEHFGDLDTIAAASYEMGRVLKPGGVLTISTELLISELGLDGGSSPPGTHLFSPAELQRYIVAASGLEPIDEIDHAVSHWTLGTSRNITAAVADRAARRAAQPEGSRAPEWAYWDMPHVVMEWNGMRFTSVHLALRRAPNHPVGDNSWARPTPALRADVAREATTVSESVGIAVGESSSRLAAIDAALADVSALVSTRAAAVARLQELCRETAAAHATATADLEEAARPHAGVYVTTYPRFPQAGSSLTVSPAAPPAEGTVPCWIESPMTDPFTLVVAEDADDIVSRAYLAGYGPEINANLISLVLALLPADGIFLDLGANIGSISLPVAVSGRRVICVEAEAANASLLEMSARCNALSDRMRVLATAVGDHVGEASFVAHGCHGQLVEDGADGSTTRVPLTTVDALLESENLVRVDVVKIDVEGAEIDVLRGMSRLAQRPDAPYIVVECGTYTLAAFGQTTAQLIAMLEDHGYVVYNIDEGRLMRRRPDEVQVTMVMDVLAAKRPIDRLPGFRAEPAMSRDELVQRLVGELRMWHPDCRAFAARMARELDPALLAVPAVAAALDAVAADAEPVARVAAAWWPARRAAAGARW